MSTELNQIINLLSKADQENAIFRQETTIFRQETAIFRQETATAFAKINEKLDKIEANTVTIMGAVISDFSNILPATKAAIETAAVVACADEELLEEVEAIKTCQPVQVRHTSGKFRNKKYSSVNLKDVVAEVGELDSHPKAVGNFLSKIMSKAFGVRFNTQKYPVAALPLLTALTVYYETERNHVHKY